MKVSLTKLTLSQKKILLKVKTLARKQGIRIYIVGGIVRDLLLGRKNFDLDIVVEGDAIRFAESLVMQEKALLHKYPDFLTATVTFSDEQSVDFVTARKEAYRSSGALPEVSRSDLIDDLQRRDFSVNAMAVSLNKGDEGLLIDPTNGYQDLKKKIIRILHDQSFIDDPTRILRAVRFQQRLGFRFEKKTERLLKLALKEHRDKNVKLPRYFAEFKKIFDEQKSVDALLFLANSDGLAFLNIQYKLSREILIKIQKSLQQDLKKLNLAEEKRMIVFLMALLHQKSPQEVSDLLEQLQINHADAKACLQSTSLAIIEKTLREDLKASEVFHVVKMFSLETILFFKLATSKKHVIQKLTQYLYHDRLVKLKITGDDIRKMDVEPYKIGQILDKVLTQVIDKKITSKEAQKKIALNIIQQ